MALRRQLHRYRCYLKLGARYYNPTTARFTQPDPAALYGGYAYAGDNPANNTDPTGRDDVTYANQGTASSPPYDGGNSPIDGSTECQIYVGTGSVLMAILGTPISSYAVNAVYSSALYVATGPPPAPGLAAVCGQVMLPCWVQYTTSTQKDR